MGLRTKNKGVLYAECHTNLAIAFLLQDIDIIRVYSKRHCEGIVECSNNFKEKSKMRPVILIADLEEPERSADKRKIIESVLKKKACEKKENGERGIYLFSCTSENTNHLVILFEGGPEKVLEKLFPQASRLLRDPRVARRLKDENVVEKVKRGRCGEEEKACVLLRLLAREVSGLLKGLG